MEGIYMKKLVKIVGLGLAVGAVGYVAVKKVKERLAKQDGCIDVEYVEVEDNNKGEAVNENIVGATKNAFESIDKILEKYERIVIDYFKENPKAIITLANIAIVIMYGIKYGFKGFIISALVIRWLAKYANITLVPRF
jgi:hypothetical protein